jgi:hypothetical protein
MTLPSPLVLVNSVSQLPVGVNVTGGSTVTVALASSQGVYAWNLTCTGTDDQNVAASVNATIVINQAAKTATFTAPSNARGSALIFRSQVNNGIDINGLQQPYLTTTFGVYVLTPQFLRLAAQNETVEGDITYGWLSKFNGLTSSISIFAAGGDLSGTPTNQTVVGLQTNPVEFQALGSGQDGYVLTWVNSAHQWQAKSSSFGAITLGGDVTGPSGSNTVVKLQNIPVNSTTPTSNQVLQYNGSAWAPATATFFTAGGDLSGTPSVQTVIAIQGVSVSSTAPTSNQVLQYNSGTSKWTPATFTTTLSGDVTGAIGSNTVVAVHGATVPAAGSLTTGNVLQVSGSSALSYGPVNLGGGSNYITGTLPASNIPSLAGDVSGSITSNSVDKIKGITLSGTPVTGQLLTATSSTTANWQNAPISFTAGGDLTGTNTYQIVGQRKAFLLGGM